MRPAAVEVLCDFDGTIARVDTVDLVLERLADPAWRALEDAWVRGEIDSRTCMAGQLRLVRGGWPAVARVLADVALDATFAPFVHWCRAHAVPLRIASEGVDRFIRHLLARDGIAVDGVWASELTEHGDGTFVLDFPRTAHPTTCGAAFCKCALFADPAPRRPRVLIGDGRSDFCCAARADLVFACSKLAIHCEQHEIPFVPFDGFDAVARTLDAWLRVTSVGPEPSSAF